MRVMIDAHMLGTNESGNERYVTGLLEGMSGLGSVSCGVALRSVDLLPQGCTSVTAIPLRPPGDIWRIAYSLTSACRDWYADVLHTTYVSPVFSPCPTVVSVHDVSFKRYPEYFSPRDRLLFASLLPLSLQRAQAVITLSEHAKQEILLFFPFLTGKVYSIPLAAGACFVRLDRATAWKTVSQRYGLHRDFLLAVGNLQPRKNLLRLVRAFTAVHPKYPDLDLVIVGQSQWQASSLYAEINRLGIADCVRFTGYVPDDDLVCLYSLAQIFVYPSVYEGFGLPVLEAMACGTPVVASNASSIPEVAGDAALLIDPLDEEAIAQAISAVLSSREFSQSLTERGKARAQQFTWRHTAIETIKIYELARNERSRHKDR